MNVVHDVRYSVCGFLPPNNALAKFSDSTITVTVALTFALLFARLSVAVSLGLILDFAAQITRET